MKYFNYILEIIYMLVISLGIGIGAGPFFFQEGLKDYPKGTLESYVKTLNVDYIIPYNSSVISLKIELDNNNTIGKIVKTNDKPFQQLTNYFEGEGFVKGSKLKNWIPLQIDSLQLKNRNSIKYKLDSKGKIDLAVLNEHAIIGQKTTFLKKIVLVVMGSILTISGFVLLFLGILLHYNNYKEYLKTGELPKIPDMVDRLKEGFLFWFKISKNNKE